MNYDNQRLREIQIEKKGYQSLLEDSNSKKELVHYKNKLDELTIEEKEILQRCDVIL